MITNSKLYELILQNANDNNTRIRHEVNRMVDEAGTLYNENRTLFSNAEKLQRDIQLKVNRIENRNEEILKEFQESANTIQINSQKLCEDTAKSIFDANLQQKEFLINKIKDTNENVIDSLEKSSGNVVELINESTKSIADSLKNSTENLVKSVNESTNSITYSLGRYVQKVIASVNDSTQNTIKQSNSMMLEYNKIISEEMHELTAFVNKNNNLLNDKIEKLNIETIRQSELQIREIQKVQEDLRISNEKLSDDIDVLKNSIMMLEKDNAIMLETLQLILTNMLINGVAK